jgi:hypothetical protein
MAGRKPEILAEEVIEASRIAAEVRKGAKGVARGRDSSVSEEDRRAKRVEILALRLAGFAVPQIADRMDLSASEVSTIVESTLEGTKNRAVAEMRELENQRLDRAQSAIWSEVVKGNVQAINTFLRISQQRSKINGIYAPKKIEMNVGIRHEMEAALADLEVLMSQQAEDIVDAEVVDQLEIEENAD